jgi:hypothetical protein
MAGGSVMVELDETGATTLIAWFAEEFQSQTADPFT